MEFIQHTINWAKGEITEAMIMSVFGALIILCSVLLWKFGTTPNTKSLIIPLMLIGSLPFFYGIFGVISNKNQIPIYEKSWEQNQEKFIKAEYERVKGFDEIFKYSYPFAIIFTVCGAILFFIVSSPNWKAISLAMITLGLMAYYIDYFASERAEIYLKQIEVELGLMNK